MQIIVTVACTPEEYIAEAAHQWVPTPESCCVCGVDRKLEPLGYYSRSVSTVMATVLLIFVRRFRCRECGGTVSFLPNFVQPYRLVRNDTIQRFFEGSGDDLGSQRWEPLLRRYAKRFFSWFPHLLAITGKNVGRSPPSSHRSDSWAVFTDEWGEISGATVYLVETFRVTAFGLYRCHQRPGE